ncbi:MAG: TerB family tellurite resistance protein [Deltaproteobacteria bacterium]|jgi:uncharacterized tellurite resistance protein B-like protein|nr:TerB family tellurite resistance protein [Deltaproteobacteria bacterium]MBW2484877.1 TerB family tellurite resistance protein [Deltaproteobacteria bacterium]
MLNFIRRTLLNKSQDLSAESFGREERTRIAASVILLEAAHADNECTKEELEHVIETLRSDFKLSQEHAEDLVELAHHERKNAVDLFEFTNHINSEFSKAEKKAVLQAVWRIIHLDGQLEKHEDHFARKLTHLLRLTPDDMIAAKLQAREETY